MKCDRENKIANEWHRMSRREFLRNSAVSGGIAALGVGFTHCRPNRSTNEVTPSLITVDSRAFVSRSDLIYRSPVDSSAEGQPIGNGSMGTLVWTGPSTVHLQINRGDVLAVNRNHKGRRDGPVDYSGGCAQITFDLGGRPFAKRGDFLQRLSLHDAEASILGRELRIRCFVSSEADLLALELDDQRADPSPVRVNLSMWRTPLVRNGNHTASYDFSDRAGTVTVVQRFREEDYYCSSAVAVRAVGSDVRVDKTVERSWTIVSEPRKGKRLILISSAASWDPQVDVAASANSVLSEAAGADYDSLRTLHVEWWKKFWSRTFVHLSSEDGLANFMERVRNLHLYLMASSSRGDLPAKWNGSLFITQGDKRGWGSQFWVWTTEISYFPLHAADAADLTDPFFEMYVRQLPACRQAARQRWGVEEGAYFLEAGPFDGPVVLPEEVAREYQDVYLGRKTINQLSKPALSFGQFECVLTQFADGRKPPHTAAGRYSYVSHILTSGCELAVQAWWRYRYTGDRQWLQTHAYPLLRETVEIYRHHARKERDGFYHLYGLNQHEGAWGTQDGLLDLAAIRGTAPLAIRAAEILNVEPDLRVKWKEFLDQLAPYPMGSDPKTHSAIKDAGIDLWAGGYSGVIEHPRFRPATDAHLWPVFPFEDWTLGTRSPQTDKIVQNLMELNEWRRSLTNDGTGPFGSSFRAPILISRTGRGADLPAVLASYYRGFEPLPNGLSPFEPGPETQGTEILGCISTALQEGLLQSLSPRPGDPEVLSVFPAWPKEWSASFRLLARGGFLVTSSAQDGQVAFVEIQSRRGETCHLHNPWGTACQISEPNGPTRELLGDILEFETAPDKHYRILPKGGTLPATRRISPESTNQPVGYAKTLPSGATIEATLGRT